MTPGKSRPELTNVYQVGTDIDLLARIDLPRDAVAGQFRREKGSLLIPGTRAAQLNVNVDLPEQYQFELDVAKIGGNGSLNLGITVGRHQVGVVIEGWRDKISGLNRVDGRLGEDNVTSSRFRVFPDSAMRTIRVIVRSESVLVDVDGNVFIDFRGDPARLSFDDRFYRGPKPDQLMLGSWEAEFRVARWVLTPLGNEPGSATPGVQPPRQIAKNNPPRVPEKPVPQPASAPQPSIPAAAAPAKTTFEQPQPGDSGTSAPIPWLARPDPYPDWNGDALAEIAIPMARDAVVVPDSPSPYVMTGEKVGGGLKWSVYDVRTGESVGKPCSLPASGLANLQLCPSGHYLRHYEGTGTQRSAVVHSFASGEPAYRAASPLQHVGDAEQDYLVGREVLIQLRREQGVLRFLRVDLRSGKVEATWNCQLPPDSLRSVTFSPGGRYVLAAGNQELVAYDASQGDAVGKLPLPQGTKPGLALAFSRDGSELAAVCHRSDGSSPLLWCIDWASGQTSLVAHVRADIHALRTNYVAGPALDWFPDNQLLLYYGQDVLDRRTGKFCYQLPSTSDWQMPRRPLAPQAVLQVTAADDLERRVYRSTPLEADVQAEALRVVRGGGISQDIGLPPLTIARAEGAKSLDPADNAVAVSVTAFEGASFPANEVELPQRLAQFRDPSNALKRLELADPPAAIAVAHFTLNLDDKRKREDVLVRYDLKRGKAGNPIPIPIRSDFRLLAVSPEGTQALVGLMNKVDGVSRFDVIDMVSRKHVAGWRPFEAEPYLEDIGPTGQPLARNPMNATFFRFLDEQTVLAGNPAGKLVCWSLPECRVLWICEDFGRPWGLSADRRYVVGSHGTELRLLDVRQATWAGRLKTPADTLAVLRAALAPDNRELLAVLGFQGRKALFAWNLSGRPAAVEQLEITHVRVSPGWSEFEHPLRRQIGLTYRRPGYVVLDDLYLIDRAGKSLPWQYDVRRGVHAANDPDQREWFAELRTTSGPQGQYLEYWLAAAELPSRQVLDAIASGSPANSDRPIGRSLLFSASEQVEVLGDRGNQQP